MRKSFLLLSLTAMVGMVASARSLSPSEALNRALNRQDAKVSRSASNPAPIMTVGSDGTPTMYVFARSDNGFMIVSADDVAAPLIGYSDSGAFDPANLPENFKSWLEMCSHQISTASAAGLEAYSYERDSDRDPIAPLIKTAWDQTTPFNRHCPRINGFLAPTGCVATAMAQVMKYYNWPEQAGANANLSYTVPTSGQTYSADFSNYKFDWDNMLDRYFGYNDAEAEAVAKLMQACGYSVEMQYAGAASGAVNNYVGRGLATYFKYDQSLHNEPRDLYTAAEWEEMVYNNLRDFGPMVYWGAAPTIAHCFVCDGYDKDGYFHFNWGWSGMSDGYFLLDALNPGATGTGGGTGGYNSEQGALFGVKPANGQQGEKAYTFYASKMQELKILGTYLTIVGEFKNYSPFSVDGQAIYRIYNEDGSKYITSVNVTSPSFSGFSADLYRYQMMGAIPTSAIGEGTYRIYPAIRVDGKEHEFRTPPSVPSHIIYTRTKSGSQYVNKAEFEKVGEKVVEDLSTNGDFYINSRIKISGTAKFTGSASTNLLVVASLLDTEGKVFTIADGTTLFFTPEGRHFEFTSKWFDKAVPAGEYTFALSYVDPSIGDYAQIATTRVTVHDAEYSPKSEVKGFTVENQGSVNPTDIRMAITIEGLSGISDYDVFFNIKKEDGSRVWDKTAGLFLCAGRTAVINAAAELPDAKPGEKYIAFVERWPLKWSYPYNKEVISEEITFTIGDASGITDIEADDNAPVEYYNLQGVRVANDNLTPGIYIRRQGSVTKKILVK